LKKEKLLQKKRSSNAFESVFKSDYFYNSKPIATFNRDFCFSSSKKRELEREREISKECHSLNI
jgi:hypothetical protein